MNVSRIQQLIDLIRKEGDALEFYGPQSDDTIDSVERALGVRFPGEYRDFLRVFGGGGLVDLPISGIWPTNPLDPGRGSVFGDTVRARKDDALPRHYVVVLRDDDTRSLWVIDTGSVRLDGTTKVLGFPATKPNGEIVEVSPSFGKLVEEHLASLLK